MVPYAFLSSWVLSWFGKRRVVVLGFCLFENELKVGWIEGGDDLEELGGGKDYDPNIFKFKKLF